MRKLQSAGGHRGRHTTNFAKGFPQPPRMPTSVSDFDADERKRQALENTSESARYEAWSASHPFGNQYDFLIHDYLVGQKGVTDFEWHAQVYGVAVDYHFPSRGMAWDITDRHALGRSPVDSVILKNGGLNHILLYRDDLDLHPAGTLGAAWEGRQL